MTTISEERERLAAVGLRLRQRHEWGARFNYTTSRPVEEPATRLFFHITVTNPGAYKSHDEHARAVENIGINRFPATGISYNALILPGGLLYEGQPWGRRGAHTVNDRQWATCRTSACPSNGQPLTAPSWNLNVNGRALALARNIGHAVTDADVKAAAMWGAAYKLAGLATRDARWHGHRCVAAKDCPGSNGFNRLPEITSLTEHYVRAGLPGAPIPGDDDMTPEQDKLLRELHGVLFSGTEQTPKSVSVYSGVADLRRQVLGHGVDPAETWPHTARLQRIEDAVAALTAKVDALGQVEPPKA